MSAHIPTPDVAEVSVTWEDALGDTKCESTFYVRDTTSNIFSDPAGFATQVWNAWVTNVVPHLVTPVHSTGVIFEDQRTVPYGGAVFPQTNTAGGAGLTGAQLSANTSFAVKKETGALGRSGRGRMFVPVWDSANLVSGNSISAVTAGVYTAMMAAFQSAVETGTYPCELGIVSKQIGGSPRTAGVFYQITGWSYTDLTIDTQRRRLPGRGA